MRTTRRLTALILGLAGTLVLGAGGAQAAFTTGGCLAQKSKVWGNLRKCQRTEGAKQLLGATADLTKCQTKFQEKLTTIQEKASTAAVPCRYADNGDNTVTDYDTGLMWVKLSGLDGDPQPYILDADDEWGWRTAIEVATALNGPSADGETLTPVPGNGLYDDWRLPNIRELETIVDLSVLNCGIGAPCIAIRSSGRRPQTPTGRPRGAPTSRAMRGAWTSALGTTSATARTSATSPTTFARCGADCDRRNSPAKGTSVDVSSVDREEHRCELSPTPTEVGRTPSCGHLDDSRD
jgi:hypothetical protein